MIKKPELGMKVTLNDDGMQQVNLTSMEQVRDCTNMTIIGLEKVPMDDAPTWMLEVDNSMATYLITNHDVDLLT